MEGVVVVERREEWCASKHTCRQRGKAHTKKRNNLPELYISTHAYKFTALHASWKQGKEEREKEKKIMVH